MMIIKMIDVLDGNDDDEDGVDDDVDGDHVIQDVDDDGDNLVINIRLSQAHDDDNYDIDAHDDDDDVFVVEVRSSYSGSGIQIWK